MTIRFLHPDVMKAKEDLKTVCPQCGKHMTVSHDELALRDGLVVCPQCLTEYAAVEPGTLAMPQDNARGQNDILAEQRFCPHCGQVIIERINFCPYCGKKLADPSHDMLDSQQDASIARQHRNRHRDKADRRHSDEKQHASNTTSATGDSGFDWKPMIPSYRLASIRQRQPASQGFQAFAYAVILALLALLAFIVYHAIRL